MDTERVERRWPRRVFWGSVIASVFAVIVFVGAPVLSSRAIDAEGVFLAEVERGQFNVVVVADGVIRPKVEEIVTARVEGTVKEMPVQPGEVVAAGTALVVLENDEIEDAYVHAVSEARVIMAEAAAEEIAAVNTIQDIEASVARTRLELAKQQMFISAQDALPEPSIPKVDYEVRRLEASNLANVIEMEVARLDRYRSLATSLAAAREAKRLKGENLLAAAEKRRNGLVVRSPVEGSASLAADVVVGRRVAKGEPVARVVGTREYFAELEVPEYWAGAMALSHPAIIKVWQGEIAGEVVAIDADVSEGRVLVMVDLGQSDDPLLPGLAVEASIVTASIDDSVYVRKPVHAREHATQRIYRYDATSDSFIAGDVVFGRASATEIQIVSGLSPGDRIIVSDVGQLPTRADTIRLR